MRCLEHSCIEAAYKQAHKSIKRKSKHLPYSLGWQEELPGRIQSHPGNLQSLHDPVLNDGDTWTSVDKRGAGWLEGPYLASKGNCKRPIARDTPASQQSRGEVRMLHGPSSPSVCLSGQQPMPWVPRMARTHFSVALEDLGEQWGAPVVPSPTHESGGGGKEAASSLSPFTLLDWSTPWRLPRCPPRS